MVKCASVFKHQGIPTRVVGIFKLVPVLLLLLLVRENELNKSSFQFSNGAFEKRKRSRKQARAVSRSSVIEL